MRNIPSDDEYFAVLIEFEYSDFNQFKYKQKIKNNFFQGDITPLLQKSLIQYIELSGVAPIEALSYRKQELLYMLYLSGYDEVMSIAEPPSLSHQIYELIRSDITADLSLEQLSKELFMSESTLRRKLKSEGNSIKSIRIKTRLVYVLHLIQTTIEDIGRISLRSGYQSQSRFTEQFKQLFSMTPSELRKTKMKG